MRFGTRTAAAAAVVTLGTFGLAGCAGDAQESQPSGTPTASGSTVTVPKQTPPAGSGGQGHLTTASFLPTTKKAVAGKDTVRLSMRIVAAGQTMTMNGVAKLSGKPAMSIEMSGAAFGGKARMILVNDLMYMSFPGATPAGKFVKIDPNDSSNPMAASLRETVAGMDPKKTFDAFDAGLQKVTFVGRETVDGQQFDRYKVSVDTKAALAAQGKPMVAGLPKTVVYDVWLDSAKLMRKFVFKVGPASTVLTASDYGKPVTIKPPPAGDIVTR